MVRTMVLRIWERVSSGLEAEADGEDVVVGSVVDDGVDYEGGGELWLG